MITPFGPVACSVLRVRMIRKRLYLLCKVCFLVASLHLYSRLLHRIFLCWLYLIVAHAVISCKLLFLAACSRVQVCKHSNEQKCSVFSRTPLKSLHGTYGTSAIHPFGIFSMASFVFSSLLHTSHLMPTKCTISPFLPNCHQRSRMFDRHC